MNRRKINKGVLHVQGAANGFIENKEKRKSRCTACEMYASKEWTKE
jgi:hypothetical protein